MFDPSDRISGRSSNGSGRYRHDLAVTGDSYPRPDRRGLTGDLRAVEQLEAAEVPTAIRQPPKPDIWAIGRSVTLPRSVMLYASHRG